MSRSGYSDDYARDAGEWAFICYRGAVASAIRGQRGQALLRDLIAALDAMPVKSLIARELVADGAVCALGAVGLKRGTDLSKLDPEDSAIVAATFDIAEPMAREIVWENDEGRHETPEKRWAYMRAWAVQNLKERP